MDCQFCTGSEATRVLKPRGGFELQGIPGQWLTWIDELLSAGFGACSQCTELLRNDDYRTLEKRLLLAVGEEPWEDAARREQWVGRLVNAMLVQDVSRVAGRVSPGQVVGLYRLLQPGVRMWFDLLSASESEHPMEPLCCGVQVKGWPLGDRFYLEELTSRLRQRGNASRVLRFITATADAHAVTLFGKVEPVVVGGMAPGLTTDELYTWYGRHGFARASIFAPNGIVRHPRSRVLTARAKEQ